MLWVFIGTFICYMPLYTLFLQEISLFVYPSSQLMHGLFWTFIDVPQDSNHFSMQRFYRYSEYTNMCSLIKCMVYCIVLSSLGCRFKNSQIVIIFFKHEHLLWSCEDFVGCKRHARLKWDLFSVIYIFLIIFDLFLAVIASRFFVTSAMI